MRPTPSTRIPVLIGGGAEPAIRRAARLADGTFSNAPAPQFTEQVGWVVDELGNAGRDPSTFRFIHYSILLPGASRADALARYREPRPRQSGALHPEGNPGTSRQCWSLADT